MPRSAPPFVLLLAFALAFLMTPVPAEAAGKHALLIGISTYDAYNSAKTFHNLTCGPDLTLIQAALVKTFGFEADPGAKQITVLNTPLQTTRKAIVAAFQTLVDETQAGDLVYIHYSGHGDQVHDSTEPGGFDSTIVPADYESPPPESKTEATSNEIAGRTILGIISQLRAKHPAEIVLSFDSCHSASAARGAEESVKRGMTYDEYGAWYSAKHPTYHAAAVDTAQARGSGDAPAWQDLAGSGYVVISACTNESCAYELDNGGGGRLSSSLAAALIQATPQTTYQELFDRIYADFRRNYADQVPQIDGDPDATLFGGTAIVPPLAIRVLQDKKGNVVLDAGMLQGVTTGSTYGIYAPGATNYTPDNQIADATVLSVQETSATLTVTSKTPGTTNDQISTAHAVEIEHDYQATPLTFDIASVNTAAPDQAQPLADKLKSLPMVHLVNGPAEKPDISLQQLPADGRGVSTLALVTSRTASPLATLTDDAKLPDTVATDLQTEARYRYALGLGADQAALNPGYHVAIRATHVNASKDADGNLAIDSIGDPVDNKEPLHHGDQFIIQVQLTEQSPSPRPLHMAVLDLDSTGDIGLLWPGDHEEGDNIVAPVTSDTSWTTLWIGSDVNQPAIFRATDLDPDEIFKVIATNDYVDFTALQSRGTQRGLDTPFADLLGPAVDGGQRGCEPVQQAPPSDWTAATFLFQVVD